MDVTTLLPACKTCGVMYRGEHVCQGPQLPAPRKGDRAACQGCHQVKTIEGRGRCSACYRRLRPLVECVECHQTKPHYGHGKCQACHRRLYDRERLLAGKPNPRTNLGKYPKAPPRTDCTYPAAHHRAVYFWGPAKDYLCRHCGAPAENWAYDHQGGRYERSGMVTVPRSQGRTATCFLYWSVNPLNYIPLCVKNGCHKQFDKAFDSRIDKA